MKVSKSDISHHILGIHIHRFTILSQLYILVPLLGPLLTFIPIDVLLYLSYSGVNYGVKLFLLNDHTYKWMLTLWYMFYTLHIYYNNPYVSKRSPTTSRKQHQKYWYLTTNHILDTFYLITVYCWQPILLMLIPYLLLG